MISSALNIELEFDLSATPDVFNVTDTTNYSAYTYSNILGNLKAVSPAGTTIHNNTSYVSPDIDHSVSVTSSNFSLPSVASGTYVFTYTVKVEDELTSYAIVSNDVAGKTITISGNYASVINDATATAFNCVDVATTPLTGVSATYSSSTGNTTVTILETLPVLTVNALFQFTVDAIYSKVFSQSYTYATPDVCLSWEQDECCSSMVITDVTAYEGDATVTRLHTLSYPDGMVTPIADITSPLQELTVTPIWTGTWTDVFTADITTSQGIINITDAVRGVKEFKVSSDTYSCQIYSCYKNIVNKYADQLTTAPALAVKTGQWLLKATGVLNAYNLGKKCGETDYEDFLTQITAIATTCGCSCDCADCADDTPTQVVGCCDTVAGSTNTIVIQSSGGSISITPTIVGTTTTFEIEVDGTWFGTQISNTLAVTSINALSDVDTSTTAPTNGQALIWNGVNKWIPGSVVNYLVGLADVDDAVLADQMVLYYDSASLSFKFRLITSTMASLTDVDLTGLASGDILQWNGTDFVCVDNYLSLLTDVNIAGIIDGSSLEWDTGTSKFIVYTPKKTLASLDDCDTTYAGANAQGDVLTYEMGTGWVNTKKPEFVPLGSGVMGPSFSIGLPGYSTLQAMLDPIYARVNIRGGIVPSGALVVATTMFTLTASYWPVATTGFTCKVAVGTANTTLGFGTISTTGVVTITNYINSADGIVTAGCPAGGVDLSGIQYFTI